MKRAYAKPIINLLKGSAIGAANTVPGVSGGTIAVITGIYDELVEAIGRFFSREWRRYLLFLLPVFAGIFIGIGLFAIVIEYGLSNFPEQTAFLFIGLILGSVPYVYGETRAHSARPAYIVGGVAAMALLVGQALLAGGDGFGTPITVATFQTMPILLGAGAIAAATMIIPGVSGSFVLVMIGMYPTFLSAVRSGNVPVLLVLVAGAAVGLVVVARLMDALLRRYHAPTYWVILGLIVGSVAGIWPGITSAGSALLDAATFVVGAGAALLTGKRR